jgi:hypothetical protein
MTSSSAAISASSSAAVLFAAIDADAFTFVPSPATTSTLTRPSRAHAATDTASSPFSSRSCRPASRAIVA